MEELRAEIKTAYAAASAACGKILHANQSLETSFQTKIINMLEKFDRSHRENVHETVQLAVQKGREQTEERLTQLDQYPEVFIAQSLASDNDQDRFQRQDNSIWEVENVEFKKSIRSRRPRLTMLAVIAQPLASDNVYRTGELIPGNSQRRPPSVVCARRGPARRAPAIRTNAQKIGNRQDRDKPRPAPPPSAPTQSHTGRTCRPTRGRPFREICWMQRLAWRRSPRRDPAPATRVNAQQIGNRQSGARPSTDSRRTRCPTRGRPYKDDLGLTTLEGTGV